MEQNIKIELLKIAIQIDSSTGATSKDQIVQTYKELIELVSEDEGLKKIKKIIAVKVRKNELGHFFGITTNFISSVTADGQSFDDMVTNMREAIDMTIKAADDLGKGGYEKFKEGFEFEFIF